MYPLHIDPIRNLRISEILSTPFDQLIHLICLPEQEKFLEAWVRDAMECNLEQQQVAMLLDMHGRITI